MSPEAGLADFQHRFAAAVSAGDDDLVDCVGGADRARRLAIYRNNWRGNLRAALRATHPVVARLVGGDFFDYMADAFSAVFPSRSANLEEYGAEFPDFIAGFEPARTLPYLPDVARLEQLIEEVLVAPDASYTLTTSAARRRLSGAAGVLSSPYPMLRIWQVNQPGWRGGDTVDLKEGAALLLVHRGEGDVLIESLPADAQLMAI